MDQQNLDSNKHCTILFGEFFQSNNDNSTPNSNVSRTIDGIYLHLQDKIQGGCDIFDLHSFIVITRQEIIEIPFIRQLFNTLRKLPLVTKSNH